MPITMTNTARGMPTEAHDEVIANVAQPLRRSAGFISHTAQISPDGVTVTEVWETREQCSTGSTPRSVPTCRRHPGAHRRGTP